MISKDLSIEEHFPHASAESSSDDEFENLFFLIIEI